MINRNTTQPDIFNYVISPIDSLGKPSKFIQPPTIVSSDNSIMWAFTTDNPNIFKIQRVGFGSANATIVGDGGVEGIVSVPINFVEEFVFSSSPTIYKITGEVVEL